MDYHPASLPRFARTLMKQTFLGLGMQSALTPVAVMALVTAVCTGLAVRFFRWA